MATSRPKGKASLEVRNALAALRSKRPAPLASKVDDPFNQEEPYNPFHRLVTASKSSGKLNISSSQLQDWPEDIYELLPADSVHHPSNVLKRVRKPQINLSFSAATDDPEWFEAKPLMILNASDNKLEHVADQVTDFRHLEQLDLRANWLFALPDSLARLVCLTSLNLSSNRLSGELPLCLLALPNLAWLDVSHNSLESLTGADWKEALQILCFQLQTSALKDDEDAAGFFAAFPSAKETTSTTSKFSADAPWPKLTTLNFSHNKLNNSALAQVVDLLPATLSKLNLSNNRLSPALPLPFFLRLTHLIDLDLSHNAFDSKRDLFDANASENYLPALRSLDVENCELDDLSCLDMYFNRPRSLRGAPKSLAAYHTSSSDAHDVLQINVAGNYLRDESARLRSLNSALPQSHNVEENFVELAISASPKARVDTATDLHAFHFASSLDRHSKTLHLAKKGLDDSKLEEAAGIAPELEVQIVNFGRNKIACFPGDCLRQWGLIDSLTSLDLSQNVLRELPTNLVLSNLAILNLAGNRLAAVDTLASIVHMCPLIRRIDLSLNNLTTLQNVERLLVKPGQVQELLLAGNQISSLDPLVNVARLVKQQAATTSCKAIDLSDNAIDKLPPEIGWLSLETLLVSGNIFRVPHRKVWEDGGTKGLLTWLSARSNVEQ